MGHVSLNPPSSSWTSRLTLPAYQVGEAARYAGIAPATVVAWHKETDKRTALFNPRSHRAALSYLQLIEVAVVAAFRAHGISLKRIIEAREYVSTILKVEYPFARWKFKTDGKTLLADYSQLVGSKRGNGKLIELNKARGQLAWDAVIGGRLKDFEYDSSGIVVRWNVDGPDSRVTIDPRIAFGTPSVDGVPTWIISGRRKAGESINDISTDFEISVESVLSALHFEKLPLDEDTNVTWIN